MQVTVTDDDVIEKSNLSRQFLFRDWNIGRCGLPPPLACQEAADPGTVHCRRHMNQAFVQHSAIIGDGKPLGSSVMTKVAV